MTASPFECSCRDSRDECDQKILKFGHDIPHFSNAILSTLYFSDFLLFNLISMFLERKCVFPCRNLYADKFHRFLLHKNATSLPNNTFPFLDTSNVGTQQQKPHLCWHISLQQAAAQHYGAVLAASLLTQFKKNTANTQTYMLCRPTTLVSIVSEAKLARATFHKRSASAAIGRRTCYADQPHWYLSYPKRGWLPVGTNMQEKYLAKDKHHARKILG